MMRKRFLVKAAMTALLAVSSAHMWAQIDFLSGDGTVDDPYYIETLDNWNDLADYVAAGNECEGKYFQMTTDIGSTENPVTKPLGKQVGRNKTDRNRFAGIFDGNGNTLTVSLNTADPWFSYQKGYCSPFAYVKGVTISNLHVTGTVTTTGAWSSGLVGSTGNENNIDGKCTIYKCHVSVTIIANYVSHGTAFGNHGGFIGIAEHDATITDSWFDGKFLGIDYQYSAGFIGINKGQKTTITNCLFNPSEINIENNNITGSCEFSHDLNGGKHILDKAYWVTHFGEPENAQGQRVYKILPDPEDDIRDTIIAADGEEYYILHGSKVWKSLKNAFAGDPQYTSEVTYDMSSDLVAGDKDEAIVVSSGVDAILNMSGYTLDRGLLLDAAKENGYVIKVEYGGRLTINGNNGVITGGNNTGNGGGIYNEGTLIINNVNVSGNCTLGNGGGIYNAGSLTVNNTTITNNIGKSTTQHGIGVYETGLSNSSFSIGGKVVIRDNYVTYYQSTQVRVPGNVCLDNSNPIVIGGALHADTYISIENIAGTTGAFTSGLSGNGNYATNFGSDYTRFFVVDQNDEAYLMTLDNGIGDGDVTLLAGENARFTRNFTNGVTSTICMPFAMTKVTGGKVYEFTTVGYDNDKGTWVADFVQVNFNSSNTVTGRPYLFKADKNGDVTFEGVVPADFNGNAGADNDNDDWTFQGTYTRIEYGTPPFENAVFGFAANKGNGTDAEGSVASVSAGEFVRASAGAAISPFRAFLTYNGDDAALKAFSRDGGLASGIPESITVRLVGSDGTETAVGTMNTVTGEVTIDKWFDFSGRELQSEPVDGGMYIHNGRKVIVR